MRSIYKGVYALIGCMSLIGAAAVFAAPPVQPDPGEITFFEQKIRPLLIEKCYSCHSAGKTIKGGLQLDSKAGILAGGVHGMAVVPGQPDRSLLIKAVRYADKSLQMPPEGKLSDGQVNLLTEWIQRGAYFPADKTPTTPGGRFIDIEAGKKHWAFQPIKTYLPPNLNSKRAPQPTRTDLAAIKGKLTNAQRSKPFILHPSSFILHPTPIDRFILAKLNSAGIKANPPATLRELIRRAYFDLIGLPPTPQDINEFINDKSPDAYEKLIDRLLASPHYGERWGRHWLDLARFAESHGYEQDYDRPYAYQYRDFVVKAFNADIPYNQFVQWQIAGDEIDPNNPLALMATGFLGAGTHATQITKSQVEKERYDELDDMSATTGTAFLGLTIGCARCHNHKYDPIPQRDYYRLLSTFTTTVRSDYEIDMDPEGYKRAQAAFDNEHLPLVAAVKNYEQNELSSKLDAFLKSLNPTPALPARGEGASFPPLVHTDPSRTGGLRGVKGVNHWTLPEIKSIVSQGGAIFTKQADGSYLAGGAIFTKQADGSYLAGGANPDNDKITIIVNTKMSAIRAIRLEALTDPSFVKGGPGRAANGNFALTDLTVAASPIIAPRPAGVGGGADFPPLAGGSRGVKLKNAKATFEQAGLPVAAAIDGDAKSAWAIDPQFGKDHAAVFEFEEPIGYEGGTILTVTLKFDNNVRHSIGRPRISITSSAIALPLSAKARPEAVDIALAAATVEKRALLKDEYAALLDWYRTEDEGWRALNHKVQTHLAQMPKPRLEKAMICSEGVPAIRNNTQGGDFLETTNFLRRGDPNQKEGVATQSFLQVLMRAPDAEKHWQIAPPAGWRTSYRRRSLANWITDVDEGAGALLARVIVNRLWQKHFGRGIVATPSDFGTQGAKPTHPELLDWFAAELIRNGWKLKPIQKLMMMSAVYRESAAGDAKRAAIDPDNKLLWHFNRRRLEAEIIRDSMLSISGEMDATMLGPGTLDENMKRRSIYFTTKRSRLIASMRLFDAPDSLQGISLRSTTTVAPQALMLMNNPIVRDYAQHLAMRIAPTQDSPVLESILNGYLIALGRPPKPDEMKDSLKFISDEADSYRTANKKDAGRLALEDFCQVLFGLNEFVYVD